MTCAEFEILLCDSLDGTLAPELQAELEAHQRTCAACSELAAEVESAVRFVREADRPEPPPALLTRISWEIPAGGIREKRGGWLFSWLNPVLQPKFAMGMAMTILSFSMLGRFAGIEVRQLRPADLYPSAIWDSIDNRAHRGWERAVKYYENLKLVYEVQARLQEWTRQEEEARQMEAEKKTVGKKKGSE